MNCMKCGAEIPENQVFCDNCLAVMEQYPVSPAIHIHLPKRPQDMEELKKPAKKKRAPSAEEQIAALHIKVLRLRLAAVILAFLLCVTSGFLVLKIATEQTRSPTGLNYTIDTSMND